MSDNEKMKISVSSLLYPCFFILFFLSFFLIESEYKLYLFGAWSLFLLFFSQLLDKKYFPKSVLIAFILSGLFALNLVFSRNLPLSMEKLEFYVLAFATFIFFRLLPKAKFNQKLFLHHLSVLTLTLNFIVLIFTFYNPQPNFFPNMNLLIRNYGHNHYVAFLLLMVPVFWWQLLFSQNEDWLLKKESQYFATVLLLSSYFLVVFSLARFALIIFLLQLVLIFIINKKIIFSSKQNKFAKLIIKTFIFLILSIGGLFFFLSAPISQNNDDSCPLIFNRKELCGSFFQNDRLSYWQRALMIFEKEPLFGSGLKTFNFASRQFLTSGYSITSYSHNIFLDNLAETGALTGGAFIFFILYLFYRSFKITYKNHQSTSWFLLLAVFSSLLNAMFDFDWNFFVIFALTLVFLAMILQDNRAVPKKTYLNLKIYFFFLAIISCLFALAYSLAVVFKKNNRQDLVIKYFPYLNSQINYLRSNKLLKVSDYESLYGWYKNDPNFIYSFATVEDIPLEKMTGLQIELAELDPSYFVKNLYFGNSNYLQAKLLADKFIVTIQQKQMIDDIYSLDYWRQQYFSKQFFKFANDAYLAKNPEIASDYYKKAILLNQNIMNDEEAVFLSDPDMNEAVDFLKFFKSFDSEKMGKYLRQYMGFYEKTLVYLFQEDRLDDFFILAEPILNQQPNLSWFLWSDLIAISKTSDDKIRLEEVRMHFQYISQWQNFWPLKN